MSESPPPRTPPACKYCRELGKLSVVTLSFTHEGAKYWKCETCGRVWASRDGCEDGAARASTLRKIVSLH